MNWQNLYGGRKAAQFGFAVNGAGDVNADGYGDIIVGAPRHDSGSTDEGAAFVYLGGPSGIAPVEYDWFGEGNNTGASYGYSVAPAGDMNGDGANDILVGAPRFWNADEGRVFVCNGIPQ